MSLTKATYSLIKGAEYNVLDYGATGNGTTDDTAAIQAAMNAVVSAGGGALYFPEGTYKVTTLSLAFGSTRTSIKFFGASQLSSKLQKITGSSDPVLSLSSDPIGNFIEICDLGIDGAGTAPGIRVDQIARSVFRNLHIENCTIGFDNVSSLINTFYDCSFFSNQTGYRCTRRAAGAYCNLIEIFGGAAMGNSSWGFDLGGANSVFIYGTDFEGNGTLGNVNTGGLITRATCDDEIGFSTISLKGAWFESNKGTTVYAENCAGLMLSLTDVLIINPEATQAVNANTIYNLSIQNSTIIGRVTTSSGRLSIKQSTVSFLTNNSDTYILDQFINDGPYIQFQTGSSTGSVTFNKDALVSKEGNITVSDSTATTLFTCGGFSGMYQVFATIEGVGAAYMANAFVGFDGTNATKLSGANGANLSLTVSGNNVQVTQTSGVSQGIRYYYLKMGR